VPGHAHLDEEIENVRHLPDFERYRPKTNTKLLLVSSRPLFLRDEQDESSSAGDFDCSSVFWPPLQGGTSVSGASSLEYELVDEKLTSSDEEYEVVNMAQD